MTRYAAALPWTKAKDPATVLIILVFCSLPGNIKIVQYPYFALSIYGQKRIVGVVSSPTEICFCVIITDPFVLLNDLIFLGCLLANQNLIYEINLLAE